MFVFTVNKATNGESVFKVGIPIPQGTFAANSNFSLFVPEQSELTIRSHTKVINLWPDKSVRWLLIEGILPSAIVSGMKVHLQRTEYTAPSIKQKWVVSEADGLHISLSGNSIIVSNSDFLHVCDKSGTTKILSHVEINHDLVSIDTTDTQYLSYYDQFNQPLLCEINQSAEGKTADGKTVLLHAVFRIIQPLNRIDLTVKIHNSQAVVHHGGKWDLGNENSIYINRFDIEHQFSHAELTRSASLQPSSHVAELREQHQEFSQFTLTQHSSGGETWNSPNHKEADNAVHLSRKGASCTFDNQQSNVCRPEPSVCIHGEKTGLLLITHEFWQKFPQSITAQNQSLTLSFTELNAVKPIELQAGETKSHNFTWFMFDTSAALNQANYSLREPELTISTELVNTSSVLPWFDTSIENDALQNLVSHGIDGENNFFAKREALDEYGWRHFGDIYADHETQYYEGDDPFVSHYNNQYDPLHGFLKQWLVSGDIRWKQLADELFDHIVNIDIYKTHLDKPEYNYGLFWHTDHYVQAQTATHRTYSKHQQSDVYMDHAGGGGPGAHHCYASGLALYYWLSGNQDAYDSLLGMTDWMRNIYEGDGTLLGLILRIKNANHLRLPFTKRLLLGSGTGVLRNAFTNQYPLDRGTGNYVNILLDTFELSNDLQYLHDAERVILNTISEKDDIKERHFEDIENTWYYVVLLQAVAKYLFIASRIDAPENCSEKILSAFLFYADYIAEHEAPYLSQKERLEYPNDTWTAQDLRKVNLLCSAAFFATGTKRDSYIKKAEYLQNWIENKLSSSDENTYTRVLVLMMQNYGSLQLLKHSKLTLNTPTSKGVVPKSMSPSYSARCLRFIKQYSIRKEKNQLVKRIPSLSKWFGEPSD